MKDVAIIGAGGFVGSSLIESLVLDRQSGVRAVVRSFRNIAAFCQVGPEIEVRRADAQDEASLAKALDGAAIAVNVTTGTPAGIVRSTRAILEACRRARVRRLIHVSSAVVYGDVPVPVRDDDPPATDLWMPYARAKAASEVWLRRQMPGCGVDVVVLRPGIVWGVRSPHTIGFAQALAGKQAFLVGDGCGIFNGIYIDNLIAAIRACGAHDGAAAGFYNVGDAEAVTWRGFFDALGPALDCDPSRLARVSGDRFQRSIKSTIDSVQALPLVNDWYHRAKTRVPDRAKAAIRSWIEGRYRYERHAGQYAERPAVDLEMWHLQRVRHKLPTERFGETFGFDPPITFADGIRRTLTWLAALGLVSPAYPPMRD